MEWKIMAMHWRLALFVSCLLVVQTSCRDNSFSTGLHSECVEQVIESGKVVGSKVLDVNQDGNSDDVVVYEKDGDLYTLLALNSVSPRCEVVLDQYLTSIALTADRQIAKVRAIELVELTGDDKPELHIWLNESGGGPRVSFAMHAIYTSANGSWQEATRFGLCLAFNSFQFRDGPMESHYHPPAAGRLARVAALSPEPFATEASSCERSKHQPVDSHSVKVSEVRHPDEANVTCPHASCPS